MDEQALRQLLKDNHVERDISDHRPLEEIAAKLGLMTTQSEQDQVIIPSDEQTSNSDRPESQ